MIKVPPDTALLNLAIEIATDRLATDPYLRDSLARRLSCCELDPNQVVSQLLTLRGRDTVTTVNCIPQPA